MVAEVHSSKTGLRASPLSALWGNEQEKTRIAVPGTVALGMERHPDETRID